MKIEYSSLSDMGRVRQNNEDAFGGFIPEDEAILKGRGALFLVADGMGGHRGGEIASRLAVDVIQDAYFASEGDHTEALIEAFTRANSEILQQSAADPTLFGMGTTCTAAAFHNDSAFFAHIGDSRAYLSRDGALTQVTQDHSLVGEMVRSGILTDEDARNHPRRNVITRSLGIQEKVDPDTPSSPLPLQNGDTVLLCSDGLTSYVNDEEVAQLLSDGSPNDICRKLVDLANTRGGRDNITVQVIVFRDA